MVVLVAFYKYGDVAKYKFILLYFFSGKAVVFIRVTSVIALVFSTKVCWFESNHPHKIEVGVCNGYFLIIWHQYKNIPLQYVPPLRATVEIL